MSGDKQKAPLFEVELSLDVGGATKIETYRFRGKNLQDVAVQVGKFMVQKKLDKAEVKSISEVVKV